MAANVAVFASPNFVVAVKLAAAKFPPGADVVSMMPYVLFSARGSGDDEDDGVNDDVAEVVRDGEGVDVVDGVPVGDCVIEGVTVRVVVSDGVTVDVPDGAPPGVYVEDTVLAAYGLNEGEGDIEIIGAPVRYTPRPYPTPVGAVGAHAPPLFVVV